MIGSSSSVNSSANTYICIPQDCGDTHLIPAWPPSVDQLSVAQRAGRAILYGVILTYLFIGMSMVSDNFCAAIDHIITRKRRVKITSRLTGSVTYISIPIWNEAVAHLTLFVLGNCAPDILLTLVEIIVNGFEVGHLGPGVIIGTGALNLFFIQTLCILVVEKGKSKRVEDLRLYFLTAGWMIFAFIWLYLILGSISPSIVEPWECLLTLAFYPLTVVSAYLVERRFFGFFDRMKRRRREVSPVLTIKNSSSASARNVEPSLDSSELSNDAFETNISREDEVEIARQGVEQRQNRFLALVKEMRAKHPNKTSTQIQEMAEVELIKEMPKSLGYYRMLASKGLSGGGDVINKEKLRAKFEENKKKDTRFNDPAVQIISFDPPEYIVMEDCGSFEVNVLRQGKNLDNTIVVDFATQDGTGVAGSDYEPVTGQLTFHRGEKMRHITIKIIDDDVFNLDTQFYVNLFNPGVVDDGGHRKITPRPLFDANESRATITKVDDDHGGIFHFHKTEMIIEEHVGIADVVITRSSGAKGCVAVPFDIIPGTAQPGLHYVDPTFRQVIFQSRQTEQAIKLAILDEEKMAKNVQFKIELGEPSFCEGKTQQKSKGPPGKLNKKEPSFEKIDTSNLGKPKLGTDSKVTVNITENVGLKQAVDNIANVDINDLVGASSWSQQFKEAISVPASGGSTTEDLIDETNQSTPKPNWKDYIFHVLTIFWKVIFATVPPTNIWNGWASFFVSFGYIGILVAIIADVSKHLGCVLGLREEITAITFVSIGTSLPDLFASLLAAKKEETADAAIGHINGACAVLVFLGLGLGWTVAAFHHAINGKNLVVSLHGFTFSITIFLVFALLTIGVVLLRRLPPVRGELGGPTRYRIATAAFFLFLWVTYIALSALSNYCVMTVNF